MLTIDIIGPIVYDSHMKEALGIDIGGVIIDRGNDNTDTSLLGPNYLRAKPVEGAIEGVRTATQRFGMEVHLVSKAGKRIKERTLGWLDYNSFFDKTGVRPENVHFVLERQAKAGIARELELTHFVDDRLEVLSYLGFLKRLFLFNPSPSEMLKFKSFLGRVRVVNNWKDLTSLLTVKA